MDEQLDHIFTQYENELSLSPASAKSSYGSSVDVLRRKLEDVRASHYDEDFIVTYAIALGYQGNLAKLRQHYEAARPQI